MWADASRRRLPGLEVARRYQRGWLRDDLVAGVVLTALLIPAGMGYARAAGLPAQAGLYATVVPLLVYAVVGPSRLLVLGPDSALAPIIAAAVLPLAAGDPDRALALAGLLAVLMGAILLLGGVLRLGFVTDLLSKPIRVGYLNGIAVVVIASQLPTLLGIPVEATSLVGTLRGLAEGIADGAIHVPTLAVGTTCVIVIVAARRVDRRVPGILIAVVGAMAATAVLDLEDGVAMVGALPRGLPAPALGGLGWSDVTSMLGPALGIALIAFADTGVLSRSFGARHGHPVDGSQEMGAVGVANVAGGLLGGFPISASSSRTPVAEAAGGRTQLTGVVGALLIVAFTVAAPGLTAHLPSSTLAAVVIVAAAGLIDLPAVALLVRTYPLEAALSTSAFLGVTFVGVLPGIGIAVGLSLVAFVNQAWRPYRTELGRIPGVRGYHDRARHPEAARLPGIVIVRFDAPLFFANGGIFHDFVRSVVLDAGDVRTVVLAAEPVTGIDSTAADELVALDDFLRARGATLVLAELKGPVKDRLQDLRLGGRFGPERFAPTVGAAVDAVTGEFRGDLEPPPT
jgi:high affinity sulfate transporter 1